MESYSVAGENQYIFYANEYPQMIFDTYLVTSGLPKVIFLAVAEGKDKSWKSLALEVKAKDEAKGLGILYLSIWWAYSDIDFERP